MAVTNPNSRKDYVAAPAQTVFPYDFTIYNSVEILVYSGGVLKTLGSDYSVTGAGLDGGGNVVFAVAPGSGIPVALIGNIPYTQQIRYPAVTPFPSRSHERGLDKLTLLTLQLRERADRSLTVAPASTYTGLILPDPQSQLFLRWRADLIGLENVDISGIGTSATVVGATGKVAYFSNPTTINNDVDLSWDSAARKLALTGVARLAMAGGVYAPSIGGSELRILTTGSTAIPADLLGFRKSVISLFDTKTDDVDNTLLQMNVIQRTNPGALPIHKCAMFISQYSMPDNGADSNAVTITQSGGGSALAVYRLPGASFRPAGYDDWTATYAPAAEFGTGANFYAVSIFVGPPQGVGYGAAAHAGGLLVNISNQTNPNANGKGILVFPQNNVYDGRIAYAIGSPDLTPGVPGPDLNIKYSVMFNGNTGFGGPAINSVTSQVTVYSSDGNGANVRLLGNGATTPSKYIRAKDGLFQVLDNAYAVVLLQVNDTLASGDTAIAVRRNVGGTLSLQTVTMGAVDSGGAGFKLLRVPN